MQAPVARSIISFQRAMFVNLRVHDVYFFNSSLFFLLYVNIYAGHKYNFHRSESTFRASDETV